MAERRLAAILRSAAGAVIATSLTSGTKVHNGFLVDSSGRLVISGPEGSPIGITTSVKEFGAKGDGSTDDTAAINAAITAANTAGGGIVGFPAGTYSIASTVELKAKVTLKGVGPASKIVLANSANTDMFRSANAGSGGADFTILEDLWLDGNKTNNASGGRGVDLDGRRTAAMRVWVSNCKSDGFRVRRSASQLSNAEGASDQIFWDLYCFNNDGNGVITETNDVSFSQCRAAANASSGFFTTSGSSATIFNDCHAWGAAAFGFNMEGSFDCVNCQAEGASTGEVRVKAGGRWIGGRVFVAGTPTNVPGFLLVENASTLTTRGVFIKETGTGGAFKAMAASVGSNSSLDFFLEGGESVAFTKEAGGSFSETVVVRPVLFGSTKIGEPPGARSLSSAEEVVPPPSLEFISVTGVAEIKKLKATFAGHRMTLKFTSTAKVLDGENLKLVSNFEATADDTLSLVCDGTNWYEVSRAAN